MHNIFSSFDSLTVRCYIFSSTDQLGECDVSHFHSPKQAGLPAEETRMFQQHRVAILMAAFLCCGGCTNMQMRTPSASAQLAPTKGSQVEGKVFFLQRGDKVVIDARITGLTPGLHGFHVHEKGDCSAPDASSAGPHFNPRKTEHGGTEGSERHAGDLGNLIADASGLAVYKAELAGFTLGTGDDSIIGRALIVHNNPDDLITQPAGNAGPRVACGLISLNPDKWFHSPQ